MFPPTSGVTSTILWSGCGWSFPEQHQPSFLWSFLRNSFVFFFIQTDSFGDFARMRPAVGGLAGYQAWGLRGVGTVLFLTPHLPWWLCLQTPCLHQHMSPVVWDLLLPDRERTCSCRVVLPQVHRELPRQGGHQSGASHFPVHGKPGAVDG